jgi:ferredoxin
MIRITQFRRKCTGCNYCVEVAPSRWYTDESDGKCTLIDAKEKKGILVCLTTDDEYKENVEAAELCPVNIIRVEKL